MRLLFQIMATLVVALPAAAETVSGQIKSTVHYVTPIDNGNIFYCSVQGDSPRCNVFENTGGDTNPALKAGNLEITVDGDIMSVNNPKNAAQSGESPITVVDTPLSAANFTGQWKSLQKADMQLLPGGEAKYVFDGNRAFTKPVTQFGNVSRITIRGADVYLMQLGKTAVIRYQAENKSESSDGYLKAQPFKFASNDHCTQAGLNFAGHNVGKADGIIGNGTIAGAVEYLATNPNVSLPALEKRGANGTAAAWCAHFTQNTDADAGTIAVAGF